jgi:translation initiation factor IF-2
MAKMKVYEIAKEVDKQSKEVISFLRDQGVDIKSHMSNIEDRAINLVRKKFTTPQKNKSNEKVSSTPVRQVNKDTQNNNNSRANNNYNQNKNRENTASNTQNRNRTEYQGSNSQDNRNTDSRNTNYRGQQNRNQQNRQYQSNQQNGQNRSNYSNGQNRSNYSGSQNRSNQSDGQNRSNYSGGQNRPNQSSGQNRSNYSGGQNRPNQTGGQNRSNYSGGQNRFNQSGGQNRSNYSGGQNRPNQSGGQNRSNYSGGQNRPNQSSGQNQNTNYSQNKPYNSGNRNFNNRNNSQGQNRNFNKDFIKDELDNSSNNRNNQKAKTSKKVDGPMGMSRSETVNRRNLKNKNKNKSYTNTKGKQEVDNSKVLKKGQFIKPKPIEKKVEEIKSIAIPEFLTIKELADKMKIVPSTIVKKLFLQGKVVTINEEISYEEAEEIALEFDILVEKEVVIDEIEELLKEEEDDPSSLEKRPPVVCVMGHVDHGKTSLLDAIRFTSVTSHEAGGITQHIGAYIVNVNGEKITFLDTPGHEAFTSMRMRGAQSTDIAILVVAADDGVMPQTVEAINHAKAAGVQIIVAINKTDKPSANVERVKQELVEYELIAEDWGGDTIFVPVSALSKDGIETLLEMIILTAELQELKANPNRNARGLIIEAELDKGRGPVATVLVQKGTLHIGDTIAAGTAYGKVRAMVDDKGKRVTKATPSTPVEILGLSEVPDAGETFLATDTEKEARSIASTYVAQSKEKLIANTKSKLSLDGLFSQIKAGNIKELNIIVKADVQGSVEAMKQSLIKLSNDEVAVRIIHGGVGAVTESDVILASASNAIIIGFNVRPDSAAKDTAMNENVDIRLYRVIYNAIEDVEAAMKGLLDPTFTEKVLGHVEVRQIFKASGLGNIAGSYVIDGKITRGSQVRIIRNGIVVYDGTLASLKRFQDDAKEVNSGYECGLVFDKFSDIKVGDMVEAYIMEEIPR